MGGDSCASALARPSREVGGISIVEPLPTPALLLDLDAFDRNVARMVDHCRHKGLALRPHGKTHKCPVIARRLIAAGAVGSCVAKLSEAEVFADHGVTGLLVCTPVIGDGKIQRAVNLSARHPGTLWVVDDADNIRALGAAAAARGVVLQIVIELCVGRKGGAQPGAPALALAELITSMGHLRFAGLQAYAGHASHVVGHAERARVSREALAAAVATRHLCDQHGVPCPLLTGGSTGTYDIDSEIPGLSELQPGSFIFMDLDYRRVGGRHGAIYDDFQAALSVLATVVSKPSADTAILDAGWKAVASDRPFGPEVKGLPGATYSWAGDEHGRLTLEGAARDLRVGDRVELFTPHCDPTVNLHHRIWGLRGGRVVEELPVAAQGMSQ